MIRKGLFIHESEREFRVREKLKKIKSINLYGYSLPN